MENKNIGKTISLAVARRNKMLFWLPLILFPFVTLLLWSLHLLGTTDNGTARTKTKGGLSLELPEARPSKDSNWNKLNFYEQADKEAQRQASLVKNDPYYSLSFKNIEEDTQNGLAPLGGSLPFGSFRGPGLARTDGDSNEAKIFRKLAALNAELNKVPERAPVQESRNVSATESGNRIGGNPEMERLENMMKSVSGSSGQVDPSMERINGMLDKIIKIQHPQIDTDPSTSISMRRKDSVMSVQTEAKENISLLGGYYNSEDSGYNLTRAAFFGMEEDAPALSGKTNIIEAIVDADQVLSSGATVKLRLGDDVNIGGMMVSKGVFMYGVANLRQERLDIDISSARVDDKILPVSLSVYDLDGLPGIYIPGSISRDASKQSLDQGIQSLGMMSMDPSIGAQAASAGIQAAKSLLGKKVKAVRVTVRAGYRVLLVDKKD